VGFQLKVDNADDSRIKDFITALRQNATVEQGAICSGGYAMPPRRPGPAAGGSAAQDMAEWAP
jgi:hypothetical protein